MTEPTTETTTDQVADDTTDSTDTEQQSTETDDTPDGKVGAEAAKYRVRLREAEGQRDALSGQLDTLRRQMVETASGLQQPAGLWASGVDPATLFDDDGRMNADKLKAAVDGAVSALGLARAKRAPLPDPSQGRGQPVNERRGWADLVRK